LFGFLQEYRAEQAFQLLRSMLHPTARVIRGGKELEILLEDVVVGDVLVLEAGARVPADARVFESIDLGVIDPTNPGCFILGIECDGRAYHSAFTARERDRIREDILRSLGWKIHRIWSPDWFFRKGNEINRLKIALEEVRKGGVYINTAPELPSIKISYQRNKTEDFKSATEGVIEYECFKYRRSYPAYEFNLGESAPRRNDTLEEIVEQEGPIHIELVEKRLISVWGISRIGSVVKETLEKTIRNCLRQNKIYKKGNFLWNNDRFIASCVRIPIQHLPDTLRHPEFICEEEIQLAIILIVKKAAGIEKEYLFTETARLFGWNRNGEKVENVISKAFNSLIKSTKLTINDNLVSLIN